MQSVSFDGMVEFWLKTVQTGCLSLRAHSSIMCCPELVFQRHVLNSCRTRLWCFLTSCIFVSFNFDISSHLLQLTFGRTIT